MEKKVRKGMLLEEKPKKVSFIKDFCFGSNTLY